MVKILFIKGQSGYDLARIFGDAYIDAFQKMSITVDILDVKSSDINNLIAYIKTQHYDLVISFNAILLSECVQQIHVSATLFWAILIDHPYYMYSRLTETHPNLVVSCVDHTHVRYLRKYYPNIKYSCFLAHGGNLPTVPLKTFEERDYQVVLMGSYNNPELQKEKIHQLPDLLREISEKVIETYYATCSSPLEDLFAYYFDEYQLKLSDEEFAFVLSQLTDVDRYIRSRNRELLINKLVSNNIQVDIFGSGWEAFACSNPEYIRYHGSIPYLKTIEIMCNSKIVLNPLPLFMNGSHERVFTSMLCGAVCVSERNLYLEREFIDNENICFYDMLNLDKLPKKIHQLLTEQGTAASIAQKGLSLAAEKHTWANRAKDIVEYVENTLNL